MKKTTFMLLLFSTDTAESQAHCFYVLSGGISIQLATNFIM